MHIDLQRFGFYKIEEKNYQDFMNILDLDVDLFLQLVDMSKMVIPILSINSENIKEEGPSPMGYTEIGVKRLNELLDKKIIEKVELKF